MKLVAQLKLLPTSAQASLLRQTLERANTAANAISAHAHATKTFRTFELHRALYYAIRSEYGLTAQMVVRTLAKVGDSYKIGDHHLKRMYTPHGSIAYDSRILSFNPAQQTVSIWSVGGRQTIGFVAGSRQRALLEHQQGETDLVYRNGQFYLLTTCDIDDPDSLDVDGVLGIDLGVVNVATDSDGETYSGAQIEHVRRRYRRRRAALQAVGTKSAKRRLKRMSGRQRRFQTDTNHRVSKRIVAKAERTKRAIAVEDLRHIRSRTRARGTDQRARHSNWSFGQLRAFVTNKAKRSGVPLTVVDAAYTSQRCSACGHTERRNRHSQAEFCCVMCLHSAPADYNAALNIERAAVNRPMVARAEPVAASHLP